MGFGPSRRMIVDFGEDSEFFTVYPGGQSQVMFSPHWEDLFDLWITYDYDAETYGYTTEHYISTAAAFESANSESTIIESRIHLVPEVLI